METALLVCALQVVSTSNGMSTSFNYHSAKDVLKWRGISVPLYINMLMDIGVLIHLNDEGWTKYITGTMDSGRMLNGDDINRMAGG